MEDRRLACFTAALFIGTTLTLSATQALAKPRDDIVVEAKRIDPDLQRSVSYRDLNLAFVADQRRLKGRIHRTANQLCFDINGFQSTDCNRNAVESTEDQVAAAITRAKRQMAGLPVGPLVAISMVIGQ